MFNYKIILVVIFYGVYLVHKSTCKSLHGLADKREMGSKLEELVRHARMSESTDQKMKYCLARLPTKVREVCGSHGLQFYSPPDKRNSFIFSESFTRELTLRIECCEFGCTNETILKYCGTIKPPLLSTSASPAAKQNYDEDEIPSQLSIESKFLIRDEPLLNNEISSTESSKETISQVEYDAKAGELLLKGPRSVPESMIVRDKEYDYFFV